MKNITSIIAIVCLVSVIGAFPHPVRAQEEQTPGTTQDILSITAQAEDGIMNALPQGVKDFLSQTFHSVETFRMGQVATSSAKRDTLSVQYQDAQTNGNAPIGLTVEYYAYKFYSAFVASPILFYLLGSFVIVYIIGTLFHRARRRGE